jgi:Uma2 family endonuclease
MASIAPVVALEEYLNTSYEPDREFVDGVLVEPKMGTPSHGKLQGIVVSCLRQFRKSHRIAAFTDTRLRVTARGGHRLPDVMAVETPYRSGKVIADVPTVIVEIKSPDDTFDDVFDKLFEYEALGTPNISPDGPRQSPRVSFSA